MGWTTFLFAYLVGGVTLLPLAVAVLLAHAYFTLPYRDDVGREPSSTADDLIQPGDDVGALKAVQKSETKHRPTHHDQDVAAGYFAVCREYTPMGINAKPIERTTPVGSATVASPSPSVYQTMYRSLFERKPTPNPLENHSVGNQRVRKAGNVFYVVLRHGHLMLFDDDEQLEVRHVVSLNHHDVSIYSGEPTIPEGELFIKRNAICLSRRADGAELGPDGQASKPFYLFSENCSAKEDFYFALLRNQEQTFAAGKKGPRPIQFDIKNIISLVQKLHSSEEHMQTRWLNAMIGRVFLGVYKTKDVENFIREKLTKKIARVKRPTFLSNIEIKGIDTGESAPYITNPRLKDLTVEGEWGMEADVRYTGNFRLEVATTARIDLGARFKVREVNLVLAVVVRKIEGHMLFKIKPPPSNRLWVSFQQPPKIEMTIEPIVSSRQITYTVILRQIESRIKEVIAETMVLPFWDDTPFFNTEHKKWRGGIFQDDRVQPSDLETLLAREGDLGQVEQMEENNVVAESDLPSVEKSHTMPIMADKIDTRPTSGLFGRRMSNKSRSDSNPSPSASSTSLDIRVEMDEPPELKPESGNDVLARSVPSASVVPPPAALVGMDAINADVFKPSASPPNEGAAAAMATLSARSRNSSSAAQTPVQPPVPSPFKPYTTSKSSHSSGSSHEATDSEKDPETTPQARRNTSSSTGSHDEYGGKLSAPSVHGSIRSQTGSIARGLFTRRDTPGTPAPPSPVGSDMQKRNALAAVSNVAASAKQWGLSALQRHALNKVGVVKDDPSPTTEAPLDLKQPMGRGRPLPPPGTPLPMPDRKTKTAPIPVPKRKIAPPPALEHREETVEHQHDRRQPMAPPPLPKRWQRQNEQSRNEENVLVVAAPVDSEPASPLSGSHTPSYVQPWVEEVEDAAEGGASVETGNGHSAEKSQASRGFAIDSSPSVDDDDYSAWMDDPEPEEAGASKEAGPATA
ncbi:testis-expressed sequence 2 protein [Podospora conica]|nr:testis-expressed sequence 2 protein [Schizothecium conicum]